MSDFYGVVKGQAKTRATRRGSKRTGIETTAASWRGAIRTRVYYDEGTGQEHFIVEQVPWHGVGVSKTLAEGIVGA